LVVLGLAALAAGAITVGAASGDDGQRNCEEGKEAKDASGHVHGRCRRRAASAALVLFRSVVLRGAADRDRDDRAAHAIGTLRHVRNYAVTVTFPVSRRAVEGGLGWRSSPLCLRALTERRSTAAIGECLDWSASWPARGVVATCARPRSRVPSAARTCAGPMAPSFAPHRLRCSGSPRAAHGVPRRRRRSTEVLGRLLGLRPCNLTQGGAISTRSTKA